MAAGLTLPEANFALFCQAFDADALCQWIHDLGIETFVGSSGRVFPTDMKAAPLLRAWLKRLRESGVVIHTREHEEADQVRCGLPGFG